MVCRCAMVRIGLGVRNRTLDLRDQRGFVRLQSQIAQTYAGVATARLPKVLLYRFALADNSGQRASECRLGFRGPIRLQDGGWIKVNNRGRDQPSGAPDLGNTHTSQPLMMMTTKRSHQRFLAITTPDTPVGSRPMILLGLVTAALTLSVAGCAMPILKDDTVQAQAALVKEAWGKATETAYFNAIRTEYASLQQQEDAALVRSLQASRDRNLASYISPSEPPNVALRNRLRGVRKLCHDIDRRLNKLVGAIYPYVSPDAEGPYACAAPPGPAILVTWSRLPDMLTGLRSGTASAQREYRESLENFAAERSAWKKTAPPAPVEPVLPLGCDKIPLAWVAPGTDLAVSSGVDGLVGYPVDAYRRVVDACVGSDGRGGVIAELGILGPDGPVGKAISASEESILADLLRRTIAVRIEAARSEEAAAAIAPSLSLLQKQIDNVETDATSKDFTLAVADVQRMLANAPELARLMGSEKVASLLDEALKAELAKAAAPGLAGNAAALPANGAATADGAAPEPATVTTKRVEAILQLVEASAGLADALRLNDPDNRVSALLILLAAQRQKVDMLQLTARQARDRVAIADAEVLGGATELALLAEARQFVGKVETTDDGIVGIRDAAQRDAATKALNSVSLAWSEGRIPANLARLRHVYLNRGFRISMAEKTTENWHGLIAPAVSQMVIASEVGLTEKDFVGLLSPLIIAATIAAK